MKIVVILGGGNLAGSKTASHRKRIDETGK